MRVLVTWGSKKGGIAGIAELIGQALTDAGFQTDVRPASEVDRLDPYDARRSVWLFSSGPLNGSAVDDPPPVPQVEELLERIGARGHVTFGGRPGYGVAVA